VLLGFFAILSCGRSSEKEEVVSSFVLSDAMMQRTKFDTARVEDIRNELKLFGKVIPDNSKVSEVFPIVGGNVAEVNVELGDYVEKGKVLAVIKSGEVAELDRERKDAQNDLLVSEKNLQIATDLYDSKLNSERDVITARKEVEKAQSELKRISEVFSIYGLTSESNYYVKSPISGFVIEKKINRDMQLRSDRSENIFSIAQIDHLWVMANVNETDISKIKLGYEADIQTLSYPDRIFHGQVDRIFNLLDPQTKTMKVRIPIDNLDYALKPEMSTTVVLKYSEGKSMLAVPASAVIFDKSKNFVMIFKDRNNIQTRPVNVYKQSAGLAYIKEGLEPGEVVITENQLLIYDALNN
jgi:cobalt-zinc-cadmium efflux system membrane fusion protein